MKKITKVISLFLFSMMTLTAFAGPNQDFGTIVGGIAGGILGNNVGHGHNPVATIGGAVIGGLVGNHVGYSMDNSACVSGGCSSYSYWDYPQCHHTRYIPCYRETYTYIRPHARICRRARLIDEYGNVYYATMCCRHMTPGGYCTRWVEVY